MLKSKRSNTKYNYSSDFSILPLIEEPCYNKMVLISHIFYSISVRIKVATTLKNEQLLTLRLLTRSEHSDAHFC